MRAVAVTDMPSNVLAEILLGPSDNLCQHLAVCAQTHPDW